MIKRLLIVGCLLLLLLQAIVQIKLAQLDSQTTDEAVHLLAGYTYLTRRDFRFNPEHPPLVKVLAALPLLALKPKLPATFETKWEHSSNFFYDSWEENRTLGEAFLYQSGNNPEQILFWARLPMILLTLLLGLAIFLISYRHFGAYAALAATGFYAFDPTINGHGHLITTDIGVALGFLLTIYAGWRFLKWPTWVNSLWLGGAISLGILAKHTAIIILPTLVVLGLIHWLSQRRQNDYQPFGLRLIATIGVIWLMLWIGYGFQTRTLPATSSVTTEIALSQSVAADHLRYPNPIVDRAYQITRPILAILPRDYLKGVALVLNHTSNGHDSFLLGQISKTGWWYYFPVLFLFKTPLLTLLAISFAIYYFLRQRPRNQLVTTLLLGASLFLLAAIFSKANLGLRHIMPVYPLLTVAIGWTVTFSQRSRMIILGLLGLLVITFALSWPTYLGYFNPLVGGLANGSKIATDSNLDWGQDLNRIKKYITDNQITNPYVEYSWDGQGSLDYFLGSYRLLNDSQPLPGDYLIIGASAYTLPKFQSYIAASHCQSITNAVTACQFQTNP